MIFSLAADHFRSYLLRFFIRLTENFPAIIVSCVLTGYTRTVTYNKIGTILFWFLRIF
jgi:hypothetical protein